MAGNLISKSIAPGAWTKFSVSLSQPNIGCPPEDYLLGYIYKGEAFLATGSLDAYYVLNSVTRLGVGKDVAVCYDGRWRKNVDETFSYYTIDEPFIAIVETDSRLYIKQGIKGAKKLMATGVSRCCLVRGWKHISKPEDDQGMCLFYLKGGRLYSREYVQQANGNFTWTSETSYKNYSDIKNMTAVRTSDFRILISLNTSRGNFGMLTSRMWSGAAVPDETITASAEIAYKIVPHQLTVVENKNTKETIGAKATITQSIETNRVGVAETIEVTNNPTGTQITMWLTEVPDLASLEANPTAIEFTDSNGKVYITYAATISEGKLVFTIKNISNSEGDISFKYTSGWLTTDTKVAFKAFSGSFTPVGLTPLEPDPPKLVSIQNVDTEVYVDGTD